MIDTFTEYQLISTLEGQGFTLKRYEQQLKPGGKVYSHWLVVRDGFDSDKSYSNCNTEVPHQWPLSRSAFTADTTIVIPRMIVEGNCMERKQFASDADYERYLISKLFTPIEIPLATQFTEIDGEFRYTDIYELTFEYIQGLIHDGHGAARRSQLRAQKQGLPAPQYVSPYMSWWDWSDMYLVHSAQPKFMSLDEYQDVHGEEA